MYRRGCGNAQTPHLAAEGASLELVQLQSLGRALEGLDTVAHEASGAQAH